MATLKAIKAPAQASLAQAIARTYEIRDAIKALEAEAKALRPVLDEAVTTHSLVTIGGYALLKSTRERSDLDKAAVRLALGSRFDDCLKVSAYTVLEIKLVHQ